MEEEDLDLFLTDIYGKFGQEIPDATKIQTIKDTYGDDYKTLINDLYGKFGQEVPDEDKYNTIIETYNLKKKDISEISSEVSTEEQDISSEVSTEEQDISSDVVPVKTEEKDKDKYPEGWGGENRVEGDIWEYKGVTWTIKDGRQVDNSGDDWDRYNYNTGEWKSDWHFEQFKKAGGFDPKEVTSSSQVFYNKQAAWAEGYIPPGTYSQYDVEYNVNEDSSFTATDALQKEWYPGYTEGALVDFRITPEGQYQVKYGEVWENVDSKRHGYSKEDIKGYQNHIISIESGATIEVDEDSEEFIGHWHKIPTNQVKNVLKARIKDWIENPAMLKNFKHSIPSDDEGIDLGNIPNIGKRWWRMGDDDIDLLWNMWSHDNDEWIRKNQFITIDNFSYQQDGGIINYSGAEGIGDTGNIEEGKEVFTKVIKELQKQEIEKRLFAIRSVGEDNWWTEIGDDMDFSDMFNEIEDANPDASFEEIATRFKIAQDGLISNYILDRYVDNDVSNFESEKQLELYNGVKAIRDMVAEFNQLSEEEQASQLTTFQDKIKTQQDINDTLRTEVGVGSRFYNIETGERVDGVEQEKPNEWDEKIINLDDYKPAFQTKYSNFQGTVADIYVQANHDRVLYDLEGKEMIQISGEMIQLMAKMPDIFGNLQDLWVSNMGHPTEKAMEEYGITYELIGPGWVAESDVDAGFFMELFSWAIDEEWTIEKGETFKEVIDDMMTKSSLVKNQFDKHVEQGGNGYDSFATKIYSMPRDFLFDKVGVKHMTYLQSDIDTPSKFTEYFGDAISELDPWRKQSLNYSNWVQILETHEWGMERNGIYANAELAKEMYLFNSDPTTREATTSENAGYLVDRLLGGWAQHFGTRFPSSFSPYHAQQAYLGDVSEGLGGSNILISPDGGQSDFSDYSSRIRQDLAEVFYKHSGIELSEEQKEKLDRSLLLQAGEVTVDMVPALVEMLLIHRSLGAVGWLGFTEKLRKAPSYASKVTGFLLGMGTEAVVMEHVFNTDEYVTGSAFYAFGKMIPGGQIFKFKGEFARLNKMLDTFARHGVQGTAAMEFVHNVEHVAKEISGGQKWKDWAKERYIDRPITEQAEEAFVTAMSFSILGIRDLIGKGKSGFNIKNMEKARNEFISKGYYEEAHVLQKNIDYYYNGPQLKGADAKQQNQITSENVKRNALYAKLNRLLYKEAPKDGVYMRDGKEVTVKKGEYIDIPKGEKNQKEIDALEKKIKESDANLNKVIEEIFESQSGKNKRDQDHVEKNNPVVEEKKDVQGRTIEDILLEKRELGKISPKEVQQLSNIQIWKQQAKEGELYAQNKLKELGIDWTKEIKTEQKTEQKTDQKTEEVAPLQKVNIRKVEGNLFNTNNEYNWNITKVERKSKELEKLNSGNEKVDSGELSISGQFTGGFETIVGNRNNNRDVRGVAFKNKSREPFFHEYTLKDGRVVYSIMSNQHTGNKQGGRRGYYSINLTYPKGTKLEGKDLQAVQNLLNKKYNDMVSSIKGDKPVTTEVKTEQKTEVKKEVKIPKSYKKKMDKYKQSDLGGGKKGEGKEKADLVKESQTKKGKEYVKQEVEKLEKNQDGTITVYRVGNLNEGHNPTTTNRKTAELIAKEREAAGLSSQIIEVKVNPKDISTVVTGVEKEVFVEVTGKNKSRLNDNSTIIQKGSSPANIQKRIDKLKGEIDKLETDLGSGKIKGEFYTEGLKKKKQELSNLEKQIKTKEVFAEHTFGKTSSASVKGKTFRVYKDGSTMGKIVEVNQKGEIVREITGNEKKKIYTSLKKSKGAGWFYKAQETRKEVEKKKIEQEEVKKTESDRKTISDLTINREWINPKDKSLGRKPLTFKEQRDLANARKNIGEINKQQLKEELERIDIAEKESKKSEEIISKEEKPTETSSVSQKTDLKTVTKKGKKSQENIKKVTDGNIIGEKRTEETGYYTTEKQALIEGKDLGYSIVKTEKKVGKNYRTIKDGYSVKINGRALPEKFKTIDAAKEYIYNRNQNIEATSSKVKGEKNIREAINNLDKQTENLTSSINNIKNPKVREELNKLYIEKLKEVNKQVEGILGKEIKVETTVDNVEGKNKVVLTTTVKNKKGESVTVSAYGNSKIEAAKKLNEKINSIKEGKEVGTNLEKTEKEVLNELENIEKGDKRNRDKIIEKIEEWERKIDENIYSLPPGINLAPGILKLALKTGKAAVKAGGSVKDAVKATMDYLKNNLSTKAYKEIDKNLLKQHIQTTFTPKEPLSSSKLLNEKTINYATELIKQYGLDAKGFAKEAKTNSILKDLKPEEIKMLYGKTLEKLKTENPEAFNNLISNISSNTKLTISQVKKDINNFIKKSGTEETKTSSQVFNEFSTELKTRIDNIERGVKIGKKEKEKEYESLREEFNSFLSNLPLNLGVGNNRATIRMVNNIKNKATLEQAIERVNKIIGNKNFREAEIIKQKTADNILKISDVSVSKSGKKVAKDAYKATGGKAAEIVSRLDRINNHIKSSNNPKTGFDYVIKSAERIETLRNEILELQANKEMSLEKQQKEIEKRKLEIEELRFTQLNNMSQSQLNQALKDIKSLSTEGRTIREQQRKEDAVKYQTRRDIIIDIITGGKGVKTGIPKLLSSYKKKKKGSILVFDNNLKTILRKLSLKDKSGEGGMFGDYLMKEVYVKNVKVAEDNASKSHREHFEKFGKDLSVILGLKNEKYLPSKIEEYRQIRKTGIKVTEEGKEVELELSKLHALEKIMQWKDITLRTNFEKMGYTEQTIKDLEKYVGPEMLKLGDYLFKQYQSFYDMYNPTYREMFGIDMPSMGEWYSPIKIEGKIGEKQYAEIGEFMNFSKMIGNSHMIRRTNNSEKLEYGDALDTYFNYFQIMEKFKHYSKTVKEWGSMFGDAKVREAIRQNYGERYLTVIDYFGDVMSGKQMQKDNLVLSTIANNLTGGILMLKPSIMMKQYFSTAIYGSQMPGVTGKAEFLLGLLKGGQGGIVDIKQSEFYKSRDKAFLDYTMSLRRGNIYSQSQWDRMLSQFGDKTNLRNVTDKLVIGGAKWKDVFRNVVEPIQSSMIKWGDKGGIMWGGQVYADFMYKKYKKEGKSDKQAHELALRDFELLAEASQQSQRASNISYWRGTGGDYVKPFTMFTSGMSQLHQITAVAGQEILNGKNVAQNTATIIGAHIILGQLFALSGNSFKWDSDKQMWGLILGNSEGILGVGKVLSWVKNEIVGDYDSQISPIISNIQSLMDDYNRVNDLKERLEEAQYLYFNENVPEKDKISKDEYEKIIVKLKDEKEKFSKKLVKKLGAFTGLGVEGGLNLYEDIGTVYRDETDNPIREILGLESDWTVGRELWEILDDDKSLPELAPSDEDQEYHKLIRETKRLKNILFDVDKVNEMSEKEFEIKQKIYFDNINKMKEIELNKLTDKEDREDYLEKHQKIIDDYERMLLTPKKDLEKEKTD